MVHWVPIVQVAQAGALTVHWPAVVLHVLSTPSSCKHAVLICCFADGQSIMLQLLSNSADLQSLPQTYMCTLNSTFVCFFS